MTAAKRRKALSLELRGVLEHRISLFERKFGRPPHPGEPLFFDPEAEVPTRLTGDARREMEGHVLALTGMSPRDVVAVVASW